MPLWCDPRHPDTLPVAGLGDQNDLRHLQGSGRMVVSPARLGVDVVVHSVSKYIIGALTSLQVTIFALYLSEIIH